MYIDESDDRDDDDEFENYLKEDEYLEEQIAIISYYELISQYPDSNDGYDRSFMCGKSYRHTSDISSRNVGSSADSRDNSTLHETQR